MRISYILTLEPEGRRTEVLFSGRTFPGYLLIYNNYYPLNVTNGTVVGLKRMSIFVA